MSCRKKQISTIELIDGKGQDSVEKADGYHGLTRCACLIHQSSKSPVICTGHGDKSLCIRTKEGIICNQLENNCSTSINCICVDRSSIWVGFSNGLISVYDIQDYSLIHRRKETSGGILCITYSPILDCIFTAGHGWEILKWSCKRCVKVRGTSLTGHTNAVRSLASGMNYLYSSSDDGSIRCWDVGEGSGKKVWASYVAQHSHSISIDGNHLMCLTHQGILILSKHNGDHIRFIDAGSNKLGLLMKDVKSESIWLSDSSGMVTVYWDYNFLKKKILIKDEGTSQVSCMVPVLLKCEALIFAKQDRKNSNGSPSSSLVRISPLIANDISSADHSTFDTCHNMLVEHAKIVGIQQTSKVLSASIGGVRNKICLLYRQHENRILLRQFYRTFLNYAQKHTAPMSTSPELHKKGLEIGNTYLYYSILYENMLFLTSSRSCKLTNQFRRYHYYRKLCAISKNAMISA